VEWSKTKPGSALTDKFCVLAHDLNNKFGVIAGYCELLAEKADPNSELKSRLLEVKQLAFAMAARVNGHECRMNALLAEQPKWDVGAAEYCREHRRICSKPTDDNAAANLERVRMLLKELQAIDEWNRKSDENITDVSFRAREARRGELIKEISSLVNNGSPPPDRQYGFLLLQE